MTCTVEGCTEPVRIKKRGLCRGCYQRWWRAALPDETAEQNRRDRRAPEHRCIDCPASIPATRKRCPTCARQAIKAAERKRDAARPPRERRNRDQDRAREHMRRARQRTTDITSADLARLYSAKRCPLCDTRFDAKPTDPHGQQLDHILPICQGGAHVLANVRVICKTCNITRPKDGTDEVQVALWAGDPTVIETIERTKRKAAAQREHHRQAAALRRYAARARQAEALTLRAMGCRWQDIADRMGYANPSGPYLAARAMADRAGASLPRRRFSDRAR